MCDPIWPVTCKQRLLDRPFLAPLLFLLPGNVDKMTQDPRASWTINLFYRRKPCAMWVENSQRKWGPWRLQEAASPALEYQFLDFFIWKKKYIISSLLPAAKCKFFLISTVVNKTLGTYHPNPVLWQWRWVGRNSFLLENPMSGSQDGCSKSITRGQFSVKQKNIEKVSQECKAHIPHQLKNNDCS